MSFFVYIAVFGLAAVTFLWLRDARIFYRTGLPLYRKAAYWGVLCCALAFLGMQITLLAPDFDILGLGLVLAALYFQTSREKEKIWRNEDTLTRFLGSVPVGRTDKK